MVDGNAASRRLQHVVLAFLSLGSVGAVGILYASHGDEFRPIFGSVNPLVAAALATILGIASLYFLRSHGGFSILASGKTRRGLVLSAAVATLFAVPTILVDAVAGIPLAVKVPPPASLLFYPAMAYIAELSFHAIPLAVLLALFGRVPAKQADRRVWACILVVSLIEPAFQTSPGLAAQSPLWLAVYIGGHVFAFNLAQLYVFRRFDFVSMVAFRLVYYVWWHILWNYVVSRP